MLEKILPYMRCPGCGGVALCETRDGLCCGACSARHLLRDGILDMLGDGAREVITPFQRVMQTRFVVSIYENAWRRAGYFLASSRSFDEEVRTVLRLAAVSQTSRVLDVACGTGVFTRPLARQCRGIVVGFDLSLPMLRHARARLLRERVKNVVLIRGTVLRLPFIAGAFPHINCCGALHLFDDPGQALDEIARVAAPDGNLSVQTTIRPRHSGGIAYILEKFIRFGFFDEPGLREVVRRRGFAFLETERHRISYTFLARRIS